MDQSTLVENQFENGKRFVERFAADGNQVEAAFWVQTSEDCLWFLYIATDIVDNSGSAEAYKKVRNSLAKLRDTRITGSDIKVVGTNNPIVKDVLAIMARHTGRSAIQSRDLVIGSVAVDQLYVYPASVFTFRQGKPMTTDDVGLEILRLMNRGPDILNSSIIIMKDGSRFNGVPLSFQYDNQKAVVVSFIVDGEAFPKVVRLNEIASIT